MKTLFLGSIEKALNAYLHSDEQSEKRLAKLAGKSIAIELLPLQITFICLFSLDGVTVDINADHQPHTKIKGTPLQLLGAMLDKDRRHQFFADDVIIEGDAEFAQQVIHLFDHIQIDWEEHTARIIGDVPAYQLSKLVRGFRGWLGKTETAFTQDVNDYLHEEAAWFPTREELQEFFSDIDNLRMDLDRLESRIAHLRTQLDKEEKQ